MKNYLGMEQLHYRDREDNTAGGEGDNSAANVCLVLPDRRVGRTNALKRPIEVLVRKANELLRIVWYGHRRVMPPND